VNGHGGKAVSPEIFRLSSVTNLDSVTALLKMFFDGQKVLCSAE
jgi:hypothetical protein